MKIDFRQPCSWCGHSPKVLACDATKIGIGFKNTFVKPIETPELTDVIPTPNKRHDRCFIFNASTGSKEAKSYAMLDYV